ncbi:phosphate regulon sensor histidine kinase PhoR [Thalassomonas sp. M1454]|uniref:phosphate regulon sensor histidine kinase PhoR n=1 Tax=Thalassomonas sp. M1454 TaxID=2594477 RepID=UPI00117D8D98|nr:phosphate regulon sensor histidine kinase PhoR [Thalassomonas sp. M1454]TRX57324.1 phosphate regulon sensor histidine kinase PhoR [Thalassomonas sp. M1454]
MIYRFSLKQFIIKQLLIFVGIGLFGYLFDQITLFLLLGAGASLIWNYRHLIQIIQWLWQKNLLHPPESSGIWGHLYDGIYRRIKNYRKKQKELNHRIRQFRDGAEALPDAAIVLGLDFSIRWSNKKANRLLGIRWPYDAGQRINNLIRSPKLTKYLKIQDFTEPCSIVAPNNAQKQLELRFMVYGDDQYLLLARDVSQLKRMEQMRRDFVANVSHELKTPLTVVRGYVEMIQDDDSLNEQWGKSFNAIEEQVTRMDRLVQQLLVLSKVEVNEDADIRSKIDMPQLINKLIEDASWLNKDKQHQITADIDPTLGILGIDSELKSACSNLIVNAMNYTPKHGVIKISWKAVGDSCLFSVSDNGCGIQQEDIDRLSERFYRVDKSRSRDTGGNGLGLAIVKHVANHHKAELLIESVYGQGSTFSIKFAGDDSHKIRPV